MTLPVVALVPSFMVKCHQQCETWEEWKSMRFEGVVRMPNDWDYRPAWAFEEFVGYCGAEQNPETELAEFIGEKRRLWKIPGSELPAHLL